MPSNCLDRIRVSNRCFLHQTPPTVGDQGATKQITPHLHAGLLGKLLGLAEGAEALCESQLRLGLKDSRLKPQPPHVYHYNQNSSYIWIALLSRVNAEYRHLTGKSTVRL